MILNIIMQYPYIAWFADKNIMLIIFQKPFQP